MARVSERAESGLRRPLVVPHLEVELSLVRPQLFLGEGSLVLLRHLGPEGRSGVLGMLLRDPAEGVQRQHHLGYVPLLEQVGRLEDLLLRHAVLLDRVLEPLDVLHQLEVGALRLDLLDRTGLELVHQVAEDDAVLEDVLEFAARNRFAQDGEDPVEDLLFHFLVAGLGRKKTRSGRVISRNIQGPISGTVSWGVLAAESGFWIDRRVSYGNRSCVRNIMCLTEHLYGYRAGERPFGKRTLSSKNPPRN